MAFLVRVRIQVKRTWGTSAQQLVISSTTWWPENHKNNLIAVIMIQSLITKLVKGFQINCHYFIFRY